MKSSTEVTVIWRVEKNENKSLIWLFGGNERAELKRGGVDDGPSVRNEWHEELSAFSMTMAEKVITVVEVSQFKNDDYSLYAFSHVKVFLASGMADGLAVSCTCANVYVYRVYFLVSPGFDLLYLFAFIPLLRGTKTFTKTSTIVITFGRRLCCP